MLVVLPLTGCYLLRGKALDAERPAFSSSKTIAVAMGVALVIGLYDGFYGPGTGTFLILMLTGLAHLTLASANGIAKVINLTTNLSALVVFFLVKGLNRLSEVGKKKEEEEAKTEEVKEPEPTKEELLLTEIRDLLKEK